MVINTMKKNKLLCVRRGTGAGEGDFAWGWWEKPLRDDIWVEQPKPGQDPSGRILSGEFMGAKIRDLEECGLFLGQRQGYGDWMKSEQGRKVHPGVKSGHREVPIYCTGGEQEALGDFGQGKVMVSLRWLPSSVLYCQQEATERESSFRKLQGDIHKC